MDVYTPGHLFARKDDLVSAGTVDRFGPNTVCPALCEVEPGLPSECHGQILTVDSITWVLFDPKTVVFLDPTPSVQPED